MSAAGKALSAALKQPDDWTVGEYTMQHAPSGSEFWIANGRFFLDGDRPTPKCIGLIERHWIWFSVKRVIGARQRAERQKRLAEMMVGLAKRGAA